MILKWKFHCMDGPHDLINYGHVRFISIIQCSKVYDNGIHEQLHARFDSDNNLIISSHKKYLFINRPYIMRYTLIQESHLPSKSQRCSGVHEFNFKQHCFFCSKSCSVVLSGKNPSHWR